MKLGRVLTIIVACTVGALATAHHLTFGRAHAYDSAIIAYLEVAWQAEDGAEPARELLEEAVARCDEAIELEPDWHPAYYFRAVTLSDLGEFERAATDLRRCIELYDPSPSDAPISSIPSRGEALELLATCERRLGKHEQALDAVLRYERDAEAFYDPSVESVLVRRALGQRERARCFASSLVEHDRSFVRGDGHLALALLHLDCGETAAALASLEHFCAERSAHPQTASLRDSVAEGRLDEAKTAVLALLEANR